MERDCIGRALAGEQRLTRVETLLEGIRDDVAALTSSVATLVHQADRDAGKARAFTRLHAVVLAVVGGAIGTVLSSIIHFVTNWKWQG
ncbi:MAG: hypothetical protein ABSC95_03865 [Acetobacteraceae bacterium]|jgi:hypothetical protein